MRGGEANWPLLERETELAAGRASLEASGDGHGGAFGIIGPPGVGKTRLLEALRSHADSAGFQTAKARGDQLEANVSFGLMLQLFGGFVYRQQTVLSGPAALAEPLFTGTAPTGGENPHSLFHGLHWLTAALAERQPLLLAVDDLQWSDRPSVLALLYLFQRIGEMPVSIVFSMRSGESEGNSSLRRILDHPAVEATELEGLSGLATDRVISFEFGAETDQSFSRACFESTGGNPLLLRALLKEARSDGIKPDSEGASRIAEAGSPSISRMVMPSIRASGDSSVAFARALAVLGSTSRSDQVARLAQLNPEGQSEAINRLTAADTIRLDPGLAFTHPLIESAVREDIPEGTLRDLHHKAAMLAREAGQSEQVVAEHLVRADADEPWAGELIERAGDRAWVRGSARLALRFWRNAEVRSAGQAESPDLLRKVALAEIRIHAESSMETARQAIESSDDPESRREITAAIAMALTEVGLFHDAVRVADIGLEGLDPESESAAGLAATRTAIAGLDRLTEVRDREFDPETLSGEPASLPERLLFANGAFDLAMKGVSAERASMLAGKALGDFDIDPSQPGDVITLTLAATSLLVAGQLEVPRPLLDSAVNSSRSRGLVIAFGIVSHLRAHNSLRKGLLNEAAADAQSAINAEQFGVTPALPAAHAVLMKALLRLGDLEGASAAGALKQEPEELNGTDLTWNDLIAARAELALQRNRFDEALELAEACHQGLLRQRSDHSSVVPWRGTAIRALTILGDVREAARLAEEDLEAARAFGAPAALGNALRNLAFATSGGRSVDFLTEASALLGATGQRFDHAGALLELGRSMLASNHRYSAREPLRQALDMANRMAARPLAKSCRDALVKAGGKPRRDAIRGWASLTPQEQRIAAMAAEGMTNRDIAASQFITVKTVESHLAGAYRKLDIKSRQELPEKMSDS